MAQTTTTPLSACYNLDPASNADCASITDPAACHKESNACVWQHYEEKTLTPDDFYRKYMGDCASGSKGCKDVRCFDGILEKSCRDLFSQEQVQKMIEKGAVITDAGVITFPQTTLQTVRLDLAVPPSQP